MPKGELIIKDGFEWFSNKNELNKENHKFYFEEMLDVFNDPNFYEMYDREHSKENQTRYFGLGYAEKFYVVQVSYTEEERIHIISARPATSQERNMYYDRLREIYS
jgi:uncharacterized DUF497 family protein